MNIKINESLCTRAKLSNTILSTKCITIMDHQWNVTTMRTNAIRIIIAHKIFVNLINICALWAVFVLPINGDVYGMCAVSQLISMERVLDEGERVESDLRQYICT